MPDIIPVAEAIAPREWTKDDALGLRQFLLANPHFVQHLRQRMPRTRSKDAVTMDQAACAGQRAEGWLSAIDEIMAMAFPVAPQRPIMHPNIAT